MSSYNVYPGSATQSNVINIAAFPYAGGTYSNGARHNSQFQTANQFHKATSNVPVPVLVFDPARYYKQIWDQLMAYYAVRSTGHALIKQLEANYKDSAIKFEALGLTLSNHSKEISEFYKNSKKKRRAIEKITRKNRVLDLELQKLKQILREGQELPEDW